MYSLLSPDPQSRCRMRHNYLMYTRAFPYIQWHGRTLDHLRGDLQRHFQRTHGVYGSRLRNDTSS